LRKDDANKVTGNFPLNDSDPALLAPTIAAKPPSTERFQLKNNNDGCSSESETAVDL